MKPFAHHHVERFFGPAPEHVLLTIVVFGLFLSLSPACAQTWIASSAPVANWVSVASSADGNRLAALNYNGGLVIVSTNAGASWLTSSPPNGFVLGSSIASSADGRVLAAAGFIDPAGDSAGNVFVSTNGGLTWATSSPNKSWISVACSADGTMMAGASAERRSFGAGILLSTDAGKTWTASSEMIDPFISIASSADGNQLVAADNLDGSIHISPDGGFTWNTMSPQPQGFIAVASSANGAVLVAASANNGSGNGGIYVSTNSGTMWTQTSAPVTNWVAAACSADGTHMVAAGGGSAALGRIYTSTNSGNTWTNAKAAPANWTSVATSADGTKLVATVYGGHIYTLDLSPVTLSPTLTIAPSNTQAVISWLVPSMKFKLQQNSDITSTSWTDVVPAPVLNLTNLENQVNVSPSSGNSYYRLISR